MAATGTNEDDGGVEERPPLTAAELTAFEQDPRNRVMYGDELQSDATEATMLCGFLNVNGLRKERWKEKNNALFKYLFKKKFDIIGLSETNLHWPSLSPLDNWDERCKANGSLFTLPCVIIHRNQSTRRGNQADVYK